MSDEDIKIHRGLNNVYFDRTKTTYINGKEGVLEYRGYNIHDLSEKSSFEEVSYLYFMVNCQQRMNLMHSTIP